ncbi:MAG: cytochrome P450, partial [Proteobacteria bacterium]|nr:cytochrome P450 [Pseudomonadota bacterium]
MSKSFVLSSKVVNNKINKPSFEKKFIHSPSNFLNDLDLFTKGQPFNLYKELRENAPVFFHPPMLSDPEPGYWVLTRYEDIKMVSMKHLNLRKEHMPFFKPDYINDLQSKVSIKVGQLLDEAEKLNEFNLVKEISQQLPIYTLSEILGIPESDRQKLIEWMEFLELAQYFTLEQIKESEEGVTDSTPDPALVEIFN